MTGQPEYQVRASGLRERICEHGVGHPDPESARAVAEARDQRTEVWMIHGCDGCCEGWWSDEEIEEVLNEG